MIPVSDYGAVAVIDLETAGFAPTGRGAGFVVEAAAAFVAEGRVLYRWQRLVRPEDPRRLYVMPFKASARFHKISPDEIKRHGIPEAEAAAELADLMERLGRRFGLIGWTAYNIGFEERWLRREPWELGPAAFDVMRLGPGGKLSEAARSLGLPIPRDLHRALPDAVLAAEVLMAAGHFAAPVEAGAPPEAEAAPVRPQAPGLPGTPERHGDCAGQRWWVYLDPDGGMLGDWVEVELTGYRAAYVETRGNRKLQHPGCWKVAGLRNAHGVELGCLGGIYDTDNVHWRRVAQEEAA